MENVDALVWGVLGWVAILTALVVPVSSRLRARLKELSERLDEATADSALDQLKLQTAAHFHDFNEQLEVNERAAQRLNDIFSELQQSSAQLDTAVLSDQLDDIEQSHGTIIPRLVSMEDDYRALSLNVRRALIMVEDLQRSVNAMKGRRTQVEARLQTYETWLQKHGMPETGPDWRVLDGVLQTSALVVPDTEPTPNRRVVRRVTEGGGG